MPSTHNALVVASDGSQTHRPRPTHRAPIPGLGATGRPPVTRAEAASALARAYLSLRPEPAAEGMKSRSRRRSLMDDCRRGAARFGRAFRGNAPCAPRHLVVALANDETGGRRARARSLPIADRRRARRLRRDRRPSPFAMRDRAAALPFPRRPGREPWPRSAGRDAALHADRQSDRKPDAQTRCAGCSPGSATTPKSGKRCWHVAVCPSSLQERGSRLRRRGLSRAFARSRRDGSRGARGREGTAREARDAALVLIAAD